MGSINVSELIASTRRFMKDWPDQDVLTASLSSTTSTVSVVDGTIYPKNFHLEIDSEILTVATTGTGTTVPVRRGQYGSTAASHASTAIVLIQPHFFQLELLDALNYALSDAFPLLYKPALDTSLTTSSGTFEYTIPNIDGNPMRYVSKVELKPTGETDYREVRDYSIRRGATPKIQFHWEPSTTATIRVHGYSPFPLLSLAGTTDSLFPVNAQNVLVLGAASYLLASGEAGRVRADTGLVDQREQANRVGSSLSTSNSLYDRYRQQLRMVGMPPLPIHAKPTF